MKGVITLDDDNYYFLLEIKRHTDVSLARLTNLLVSKYKKELLELYQLKGEIK